MLTGATGFLGVNIQKRLEKDNRSFVAVSKTGGGDIQTLDLTDFNAIRVFLSQHEISTVIHAAGEVDLSRDYETAIRCINNNLIATVNLLEACKEKSNLTFILLSSEEIYGEGHIPFKEEQLPFPPSPYSVSKLAAENYLRYFALQNSCKAIVLRLSTVYGPNMPEKKFLADVIKKSLRNEPILLNSGKNKRDYIYVDDAVESIMKAIDSKDIHGISTINIGSSVSTILSDIIELIITEAKSRSELKYGTIPDRITESSDWSSDNTKAKELLEWQPTVSLEDGISRTISHFRAKAESNL